MIDIRIHVENDEVLDSFNKKELTMDEVAAVIYRLEQMKLILLELEFDNNIIVEEDLDE